VGGAQHRTECEDRYDHLPGCEPRDHSNREIGSLGFSFPSRVATTNEAAGEKVEREKPVLAVLPELSLRIIEHACDNGRLTISDIVKLTGTSTNTLKQHFR
jgi:hypothetical protein